jgi:sulfate transport system substrate-binding protein
MSRRILVVFLIVVLAGAVHAQDEPVTLTLAAYTTPREAYAEIIPLFQDYWRQETGQEVQFQESYLGSGAQSRAVEGGFEADIVALSLERDVTRLVDAGLISPDWQDNPYRGMVSTSIAVLLVRPGNPKNIQDWADLARSDVEVLTPDPATSGGAQWNVLAAYGAAQRGYVEGYEATEDGAFQFLVDVFSRVSVLDPGARESVITFASGVGDVLITYENEYYAGIAAGDEYEIVYPTSTILIENPVAVVDTYVDAHGTREAAEGFIEFLYTPEAQAIYAAHGYRPPILSQDDAESEDAEAPPLWEEGALDEAVFPTVEDIFTIDEFGGWNEVGTVFFSEDGIYTRVTAEVQGR